MTTAIATFNPSAMRPSFAVKGELSAFTKALTGGGGGGKRISIKNGVFRLLDNGKEITSIDERYLDTVVINAAPKVGRTFYAAQFKEGETVPPACWSADGELPDKTAATPQAVSCATCPQNIKGSGKGDSRACRYSQRLAVVLANDVEGDILQLTVPATSLFGKAEGDNRPLQEYARYHAAQGNDISMMVTRIRFDLAPNVEGTKIVFKAMRWLSEEEFASTSVRKDSMEAISAITMTVAQLDSVAEPVPGTKPVAAKALPAPVAAMPEAMPDDEPPAPAPKAKAKAKPAAMPDDEAPPEPKVKKAVVIPAPASASSLAAVLGEWDDE